MRDAPESRNSGPERDPPTVTADGEYDRTCLLCLRYPDDCRGPACEEDTASPVLPVPTIVARVHLGVPTDALLGGLTERQVELLAW
jgi:hypothetical protein